MNTEAIKTEIANIIKEKVFQPSRKQYPVAKHQMKSLTELGILDLMPRDFGYTDAAVIIDAARDNGTDSAALNQYGEGVEINSSASKLFMLLNEKPRTITEGEQQAIIEQDDDTKLWTVSIDDLDGDFMYAFEIEEEFDSYNDAVIAAKEWMAELSKIENDHLIGECPENLIKQGEYNRMKKVILVGRHQPLGLDNDVSIVAHKNILWSNNQDESCRQLASLMKEASENRVDVLLQNIPTALAFAFAKYEAAIESARSSEGAGIDLTTAEYKKYFSEVAETKHDYVPRIGVVVSVLSEREAGVETWYNFDCTEDMATATQAVKAANGRANVEFDGNGSMRVTVDPVAPFVFSHIDWL